MKNIKAFDKSERECLDVAQLQHSSVAAMMDGWWWHSCWHSLL